MTQTQDLTSREIEQTASSRTPLTSCEDAAKMAADEHAARVLLSWWFMGLTLGEAELKAGRSARYLRRRVWWFGSLMDGARMKRTRRAA